MSYLARVVALLTLGCCAGLVQAEKITDLSTEFDYFANSWGLIGLKDYPSGCRITPDWHLQLADGIEAEWLLGESGQSLPRGVRRTSEFGGPLVCSYLLVDRSIDCWLRAWAMPLPGRPWDYRNRGADEGNFLLVATARLRNRSRRPRPARIAMRLLRQGAPLQLAPGPDERTGVEGGRARAMVERRGTVGGLVLPDGTIGLQCHLAPGPAVRVVFWLPFRGLDPQSDELQRAPDLWPRWVEQHALDYWSPLLHSDSGRVSIPDSKALSTYFASLAYTFIGRDDGSVHPGEGFYDGYFLRDGAYQAWALELAGYLDEARPSVLETLQCQKPNGQLESQGGELDGNGQGLWNLWRHYTYTRDGKYLRQVYPAIRRSMEWLAGALKRAPGDPDAAFAGVLPKSWADGEALPKPDYHVVGYDVWNLRGALCAVEAAKALGEAADAEAWGRLAADYRAALLRLIQKTGAKGFPPTLELEGTDWGNLEVIFPTQLFSPHDPRVSATLAEARKTFVEGTIRWCPKTLQVIHPYMSTFITNSHVIRGEQEKAVEGLYAFLLHSTSDDGFPEGVYYPSRTAWGDTIPHLWAAAMYVNLVRNMLVREDGASLHFASAVPGHWLEPGEEVAFRHAPTTFGEAGLWLQAEESVLHARLDVPSANRPQSVVLHTPPGIRILDVRARQGRALRVRAHEIVLKPEDSSLDITIEREPAKRITYERTVAHYLAGRKAPNAQLRDLLPWPLAPEPDAVKCVALDLRSAANVDPFTAPFGTLNPGKYLFTGLSTGRITAAGVPFDVIDPQANGGKGFVALQGSDTSVDFPGEVTIPVGLAGQRAFFFGQVTGWQPSDPGDPKTHAVGEYILHYADGRRQIVPLISGATVDDWAMPPAAQLTQPALRGDPWHLSVLAVKLRAAKLEKITFRDEGTPASPLLAAVTIEQR